VSDGTLPRPKKPDVVARARRSLLSVRSSASGGTGWVVLGNGLIMTSQEAVGHDPAVRLDILDSGRQTEGRVIWVDVARDLAFVLPAEQLSLPPLLVRPDLPRLGESVLALSALPDEPYRVTSGIVSAVDHRIGPLRCFEVDARLTSAGGPVLDGDGRVIGVGGLDLPRGALRRRVLRVDVAPSLAIPISALGRVLAAVDIAPQQFEGRVPMYRCPACNEPFQPRDGRCLVCGRILPHAWDPVAGASSLAERAIADIFAELGAGATVGRTGRRSYSVSAQGAHGSVVPMTLDVDAEATCLRGKLPLATVPSADQEPFYRFLLTLNDQMPGSQRVFVEIDTVYLTFVEPIAMVRPGETAARLNELVRERDRLKKVLSSSFEVGDSG
jgi:hypothetical protein